MLQRTAPVLRPEGDLRVPRRYHETLPVATQRLLRCAVVDRLEDEAVESYVGFGHYPLFGRET